MKINENMISVLTVKNNIENGFESYKSTITIDEKNKNDTLEHLKRIIENAVEKTTVNLTFYKIENNEMTSCDTNTKIAELLGKQLIICAHRKKTKSQIPFSKTPIQ